MFTYVRLRNFKSFSDVEVNFQSKKDTVKPLSIIYGANGSGKSTIAQAFMTLEKTKGTMKFRSLIQRLLENNINNFEDLTSKPEYMAEFFKHRYSVDSIDKIIREVKMKDSLEPMCMEFGFVIDGAPGFYMMEFDDTNLIHERLDYRVSKRHGCYFDIDADGIEINSNIFESEDYYNEIKKTVEMYQGKHSLLSILYNEIEDKSGVYVENNFSENLKKVLDELNATSLKMCDDRDVLKEHDGILQSLDCGEIDPSQEEELANVEKVLNDVFISLFDDVISAYYKKTEKNGTLEYMLYLKKRVGAHVYEIDFMDESSGTQEVLDSLPYLMLAIAGKSVVIDEYGTGVHDVLSSAILNAIAKYIKGQLIITTHNTMLMEQKNINQNAFYYIMCDELFNKSIKCVSDIETRLHPNYNIRTRYLTYPTYKDGLPKKTDGFNLDRLAKLYE